MSVGARARLGRDSAELNARRNLEVNQMAATEGSSSTLWILAAGGLLVGGLFYFNGQGGSGAPTASTTTAAVQGGKVVNLYKTPT